MQGMRELLRSSLRRSLRDLTPTDRLAAAWPVACGTALAAHGEIEQLDADGNLLVHVSGQEWSRQFFSMRSALAADLAKIAGVPVREIHFKVKP